MESKERNIYQGCYGSMAKPSEIKEWLRFSIVQNIERQNQGLPRCTLNIWSAPGVGKTSIVKALQKEQIEFNGKLQNIKVIDIPLAQIEEMGDVTGFPVEQILIKKENCMAGAGPEGQTVVSGITKWVKAIDAVVQAHLKEGWELENSSRTIYAPPSWVPREECPGVILFDDGNRASQRIMRGLMQLVQDYRTIAWSIPRGWTIVFTGNPDNRYNQVTSMDAAQLTRMKHITLEVSAKEWAIWAQENNIDKRGVNFVLFHQELIIGKERTNPRSLTEFFYSLKSFPDLTDKNAFHRCMIEASASLDEETVSVLGAFLTRESELVIEPEMVLENPDEAEKNLKHLMSRKEPRVDIIAVTMNRLIAFLFSKDYEYKECHIENFRKWMLLEDVPKDLVYSAMNTIANSGWKHGRKFISGKELLNLVLDMYKKD